MIEHEKKMYEDEYKYFPEQMQPSTYYIWRYFLVRCRPESNYTWIYKRTDVRKRNMVSERTFRSAMSYLQKEGWIALLPLPNDDKDPKDRIRVYVNVARIKDPSSRPPAATIAGRAATIAGAAATIAGAAATIAGAAADSAGTSGNHCRKRRVKRPPKDQVSGPKICTETAPVEKENREREIEKGRWAPPEPKGDLISPREAKEKYKAERGRTYTDAERKERYKELTALVKRVCIPTGMTVDSYKLTRWTWNDLAEKGIPLEQISYMVAMYVTRLAYSKVNHGDFEKEFKKQWLQLKDEAHGEMTMRSSVRKRYTAEEYLRIGGVPDEDE